jgi:hypothetical protein
MLLVLRGLEIVHVSFVFWLVGWCWFTHMVHQLSAWLWLTNLIWQGWHLGDKACHHRLEWRSSGLSRIMVHREVLRSFQLGTCHQHMPSDAISIWKAQTLPVSRTRREWNHLQHRENTECHKWKGLLCKYQGTMLSPTSHHYKQKVDFMIFPSGQARTLFAKSQGQNHDKQD